MSDHQALISDLVLANRILANEDVLDGFGHVSARNLKDSGRYFLARAIAPETVTRADILEFNLDGTRVSPGDDDIYSERVIHGAIYEARPDVMAICHCHAEAILPFCVAPMQLQPVTHLGATLGDEIPLWDSHDEFGDTNLLVATPEEGASLASALGPHAAVLMRHHGATVTGASLGVMVFRSIYMAQNARVQMAAHALGGFEPLTPGETALSGEFNLRPRVISRSWARWLKRLPNANPDTLDTPSTDI